MKKVVLVLIINLVFFNIQAQVVKGRIFEKTKSGSSQALIGVLVKALDSPQKNAVSDNNGDFSISGITNGQKLVFSYVGYITDTLKVLDSNLFIEIELKQNNTELNELVVKGSSSVFDKLSPIQTEIITSKILAKAACCNLSESFETNASLNVNYTDAVTGAKQIQLMGLAGQYVQMNFENIPLIRGLATTFGLNFIPGTWVQSIDVSKGTSSVVNGFESMTGAINVELQKPDLAEKLYLNTYLNSFGRAEINLNLAKKINPKWSTLLLSHGSTLNNTVDNNKDGFLDLPKYSQINLLNRWKYSSSRLMAQFGVHYLNDSRVGGQVGFENKVNTSNLYGFTNQTNRLNVFSKIARLYPSKPYRGLGLILSASTHDSKSFFGFKPYMANQNSFYSNLIYQDIINNTNHTYKAGLSIIADDVVENYTSINMNRTEIVPGAFVEYTYNNLDRTIIVGGLRFDNNNRFGSFLSSRVHFKHDINQNTSWRFTFGNGQRSPFIFAENYGNLVSSRQVVILDNLKPEISWNIGTSIVKEFGKSNIVFDVYHTNFQNQTVIDAEHKSYLYFYNLEGRSFTNSAQIELNLVPNSRWELKFAYRYLQVKQTLGKPFDQKVLLDKMYVNRDRVLINAAYALPYDKWKFDITFQWNGKRRIPELKDGFDHNSYLSMPIVYAPAFLNINTQITKTFIKWDAYLGIENLGNFTQKDPIINPLKPFEENFDAGMAWGPIVGRIIYVGIRYKIK